MNEDIAIKQLKALKTFEVRVGMRLAAESWNEEWKTLIATIMSAQSRDETTIVIAENLFYKFNTLNMLTRAKYFDVLKIFSGLNYNKTKAKNVVNCAKELAEKYGGKVPHDFSKLIELSGVGRKTANVFLSEYGYEGLAVDTHVFHIARKLRWSEAKTREGVEMDLRALFPRKFWNRVNPALVKFGKTYTSKKEKEKILEKLADIK